MAITRHANQTSKMKPGRAKLAKIGFAQSLTESLRTKMTIARHAGQTSKVKHGRAQARQNWFCPIFKSFGRNDYCQARLPNLENEVWKGPGSPTSVKLL